MSGVGGFVYVLASRKHGTLYVGVTSDLLKRVYEHRTGALPGFTRRHHIKLLVYFEPHDDIEAAIIREKQLKEWRRDWKVELIERGNLDWEDLSVAMLGFEPLETNRLRLRHPGESRDPRTRNW